MEYRCEDLPAHGIVLVPPSSPDYAALAADIEKRAANPVPGSPPSLPDPLPQDPDTPAMVLINRAQTGIAAVSWIWKYEAVTGQTTPSSILIGQLPQTLAPFGIDERSRKLYSYWHVILPGSKRIVRGSRTIGDNTDVRPPQPDEMWKGGIVGGSSGGGRLPGPLKSITLAIDGVFFMDGGFAGPDSLHNFDRVTAEVAARLEVARMARAGHDQGVAPIDICAHIEALTGPDRGPTHARPGRSEADYHTAALQMLAWQIAAMRRAMDDDRAVYQLMSWTETPLPNFRKL